MSLTIEAHIGKKYAIYIPKALVRALGLKEGGKVLLTLVGRRVVLESVHDPLQLALEAKKFTSITPDEVEKISLEEQRSGAENPENPA